MSVQVDQKSWGIFFFGRFITMSPLHHGVDSVAAQAITPWQTLWLRSVMPQCFIYYTFPSHNSFHNCNTSNTLPSVTVSCSSFVLQNVFVFLLVRTNNALKSATIILIDIVRCQNVLFGKKYFFSLLLTSSICFIDTN